MNAMICGMSNFIGGCSKYNSLALAKPILARKRCFTSDDEPIVLVVFHRRPKLSLALLAPARIKKSSYA